MKIKLKFSLIPICCLFFAFSAFGKTKDLTIEPYVFENSKKEQVKAELGRLKVPENRQNPNSKKIEIAFVRFKSTSKNPGSPIIYLAGGPGGSGISSAKFGRFELFMAMREFGDVIALDQRGTGMSKPNLSCPGNFDLPFDKPLTQQGLIDEEARTLKTCAEEWKVKGFDSAAFNTVENADDLNDLRIALGAKKVSLWGISYGTHLALATIRRHGKFIDRSVLAGVEGVDDTLKLPDYTQDLMVELSGRLKSNPEISKKIPDLLALIKKVHNRLENEPVEVELTDPETKKKFKITIGLFDLQFLLSAFSGSNEAQALIPGLYYSMDRGDFSFLAGQIARYRKGGVSSLMSVAMDCASGVSPKRSKIIENQKKNTLFGNAINTPFPEVCSAINYRKLGENFHLPIKSKVPVLFISGTLDGRTPVSNAQIARKGFKNSVHLVIDGAGHSDPLFLSTPKIKETMGRFMRGEKLAKNIRTEMDKPFKFVPVTD